MDGGSGDVSAQDYGELVNTYVLGNRFDETNPELRNVKRRLYEENNVLNGEVTFDFDALSAVGLYRYQGRGPYMFHVGARSDVATERFESSNGMLGTERMPVVFWPDTARTFTIVASIQDPAQDTRSLLPLFQRYGLQDGGQ